MYVLLIMSLIRGCALLNSQFYGKNDSSFDHNAIFDYNLIPLENVLNPEVENENTHTNSNRDLFAQWQISGFIPQCCYNIIDDDMDEQDQQITDISEGIPIDYMITLVLF